MQRRLFLGVFTILSLFLGHYTNAQTLHIDATNSPYQFPNGYDVALGDSLLLHPGAIIEVGVGQDIIVHGTFRSLGSQQNPVIIRAIDPSQGWGILDIRNTSDSLVMQYSFLEEGRLAVNDRPIRIFETHITNNQTLAWNDMVFRVWFSEITMSYSSITGSNQGEGLICHDCINPTIEHCTFYKMPDAIELINCQSGLIRSNIFHDMRDDAVDLNHCSDVIIDSNLIYNVADRGLEIGSETFGSCSNITVQRNCFFNCKEAVNVKEGSTASVINNTFYNNDYAVVTLSAEGFGQEMVQVTNCIFENNNVPIVQDTNALVQVHYSCFSSFPHDGIGNFQGNPLFLDPQGLDFNLYENSPCINSGSPFVTQDADGSRSDIGAWHSSTLGSDSPNSIKIWPVPALDELNILLMDDFDEVHIMDFQGNIVQSHVLSGKQYLLNDVSELSPGMYHLRFISSEQEVILSFVKL